jgi:hypothetical protein
VEEPAGLDEFDAVEIRDAAHDAWAASSKALAERDGDIAVLGQLMATAAYLADWAEPESPARIFCVAAQFFLDLAGSVEGLG